MYNQYNPYQTSPYQRLAYRPAGDGGQSGDGSTGGGSNGSGGATAGNNPGDNATGGINGGMGTANGNHSANGQGNIGLNAPNHSSVSQFGFDPSATVLGSAFGPVGAIAAGVIGGSQFGMSPNDAVNNAAQNSSQANNNGQGDGQYGVNPTTGAPTVEPGNFPNLEQAGTYGANEAYNLYNQGPALPFGGPQVAGFGNTTNQAHNQITNAATGNPYLAGATQQVSNLTTDQNPFLQGFNDFSQQQNQHLDAINERGMNDIQDRMNSQFGAGGRSGSGFHSLTQGRAMGDYSASLYGNAFDNQQNRNLAALNGGSAAFENQNMRKLEAAGMLPDLNNAKFDDARMLQGVGREQDIMSQLQLDDRVNAHNTAQNSGWANLQNYQNIVNGVSNTQQPSEPDRNSTSDTLGDIATAAAIYDMYQGWGA